MNQASEFGRWLPGPRVVLYDGQPKESQNPATLPQVVEDRAVHLTYADRI